jgi:hypothetical protein
MPREIIHIICVVFCSQRKPKIALCNAPSMLLIKLLRGNPEKGREIAAPSNIKEIQEIQGGQEVPHDGDAINPKDA